MTIAKISEITSSSNKSFEDAIEKGIKRANKTILSAPLFFAKAKMGSIRF